MLRDFRRERDPGSGAVSQQLVQPLKEFYLKIRVASRYDFAGVRFFRVVQGGPTDANNEIVSPNLRSVNFADRVRLARMIQNDFAVGITKQAQAGMYLGCCRHIANFLNVTRFVEFWLWGVIDKRMSKSHALVLQTIVYMTPRVAHYAEKETSRRNSVPATFVNHDGQF